MIKRIFTSAVLVALLAAAPAAAQIIAPGNVTILPPPPSAPPPPSMAVPVVPKLDALPTQSTAPPARRSFGDRITDCLQDGAAAGLGPRARAAYSRSCANR
jgi:hypothetical protein